MDVWRWVSSGSADGATQMAMDQALLESVGELGIPTMRVYGWNPYCISLGYHQSSEHVDFGICREKGVDVVRRPTGGRAVFHAEEVTYAVVIPEGHARYSERTAAVYNFISRGLIRGIRQLGVPAELEGRSPNLRTHYQTSLAVSCFSAAARYEVVVGGKKLVGSAQRRISGGVLQHGSILTGDAHLDLPEYLKTADSDEREQLRKAMEEKTVSVGRYLRRQVHYEEVAGAIKRGMEEENGVSFEVSELSKKEKERVQSLGQVFLFSSY